MSIVTDVIAGGFNVGKKFWGSTLGKIAITGGTVTAAGYTADAIKNRGNSAAFNLVQGPQEVLGQAGSETGVNVGFATIARIIDKLATWLDSINPNGVSDFTRGIHNWARGRVRGDAVADHGSDSAAPGADNNNGPNGGPSGSGTTPDGGTPSTPDKPFDGYHATSVTMNGVYTGAIEGTGNVLGAPVDLINGGINAGLKLFGLHGSDAPIGGSQWMKGSMSTVYNAYADFAHLNVKPENATEETLANTAFTTTKIGSELTGAFFGATAINAVAKTAVTAGKVMDVEVGRDIFAAPANATP